MQVFEFEWINKGYYNMETIVSESGTGKYAQEIRIGEHTLKADEPLANGGNDSGPSPYDFLLAGLGACTSMTLRMYADLKQIPLKKVIVTLQHEKIYAEDCAECENKNTKIDHINRQIQLEGNLTEEQRQKLLEMANKCPVHRTLTSKILITTELITA
ncbi:OsmC family protein [Legionella sp. 27fs60]|uniref:OsmC family protein n=2 Tax=Legionella bononiensis TaxID=2793102 RepID=A0ABS1WD70_9GAMM|nr:OsmC family protein [Legionella bononiensis]MBL7527300.1 OsmC family protein [Legionella bononiensis]MBL7562269.1 OsmC family protein [Legionella bononiensis]